ncbi:VWA domain-containing protein [Lutibacter sp.]|uniref:VWA domain-containing protein n=1 Tax=Lutibacter sp. TaxID=1925666 RepID=UPI003566DD66
MEKVTFLWILLALFVAFSIAAFQYLSKNEERRQLNYWLSFFRFTTIFFILILLINPAIKKINVETIKPNLLVAVDNSKSIKYNSQNEVVKSLVEKIKKNSELNNKYNISFFGFGSGLYPLEELKFEESQTNLSIPFQEFSKLYKTGSSPVILISDGNQTVGNAVEFVNYKSPVFPFIVGDTTIFEDIYISQLNINQFTFINNQLPVELFINYTGSKPITKNLNVFHKGTKVYSEKFQFSKNQNVRTASFFLKSTDKGNQYYTAKVEELDNEQNTQNNTENFSIDVIEEKSDILILTSVVHPDLGMLKKSIESNKQRTATISTVSDFKGKINDYQLVILYQPTVIFKNIFLEISQNNLNYFVITGRSTDWNFLNTAQSNFSKKVSTEKENYSPIFNSNYATFLSTDIGFSNFAPIEDYFGDIAFSVPYQILLFQKIGNIETEKPLLATFENNNQKSAILFGENSWRWRMNSFVENKSFERFDGFFAGLIHYLVSSDSKNRLNVNVNPIYYANEIIQISASYLDENFNFDNRSKLWLTVTNEEANFIKKIPFAVLNNRFIVELPTIPFGEYKYTVSVENQDNSVSGSFKILPFEIEAQYTNANYQQLKNIATDTKGFTFYNKQEQNLIDYLIKDNRFKSVQKSIISKTPLIDWKWILGLIILSLSIEWFARKYYGKI